MPSIEQGEVFSTLFEHAGSFSGMHDTLIVRRGFPMHYQQSRKWFKYRSVTKELAAEWEKSVGIRITHAHLLVTNVCFAVFGAIAADYLIAASTRK